MQRVKIGCVMKVDTKEITRTEIIAPKGWILLSCGASIKGDLWNGGNGKTWIPCPIGVDVSCCARVIRKE